MEEEKYLAEVPLKGSESESGGIRAGITFEWLESEMKRMLVMEPEEVITQVNVSESGLVFYFGRGGSDE